MKVKFLPDEVFCPDPPQSQRTGPFLVVPNSETRDPEIFILVVSNSDTRDPEIFILVVPNLDHRDPEIFFLGAKLRHQSS